MDLPAGVAMPGMATPTEIQELTDARGQDAEVLYLQLMTTHHLAGVEMAQAGLDLASDPDVLAVAQRMVDAQRGEVALMRDMTDTMYNPERPPGVGHFAGTDLVVEHVESYWCPTFPSTDITGEASFRFPGDPHAPD